MNPISIKGFLKKPKIAASRKTYTGRFTCGGVQWTGQGTDALVTFTMTLEQLADAAENQLLWTDQDVQRGIKPGLDVTPPRQLAVADGYPDQRLYVFDDKKADEITEKLLENKKLFLNPLVWNLRPGTFEAFFEPEQDEIYIYSGKVYLPDSHHRHQAILKAVRLWREDPGSSPRFSPNREMKIELYFLSKEDEGNYFFAKNQLPKPAAKSKAFDLTTVDDLSLLAKKVIEKSRALRENVNRVTDRLPLTNPQVVTLSTLREMMRTFAPAESLDDSELEGLASVAATLYDLLAEVRPELGRLSVLERRLVRNHLIVDAAVMMQGYAFLMRDFNDSIAVLGARKATADWAGRLKRLSAGHRYSFASWSGDLFSKENPLWQRIGVVKRGRDGRLTVLNTGAARAECGRILHMLLMDNKPKYALAALVKR